MSIPKFTLKVVHVSDQSQGWEEAASEDVWGGSGTRVSMPDVCFSVVFKKWKDVAGSGPQMSKNYLRHLLHYSSSLE